MSCRRAFEIDLAGFLADPSGPELTDFREHYPTCRDCAAEVRAWTDLDLLLRASAPAAHPEPEELLRYEDGGLDRAGAARVEAHVTACAACRDELTALRRFDFATLSEGADPAGKRAAAAGERPGGLALLIERLRGLVLHPAFAYAVVLLLLYPAARSVLDSSRLQEPAPREAFRAPATAFDEVVPAPRALERKERAAEGVEDRRREPRPALAPSEPEPVPVPESARATRAPVVRGAPDPGRAAVEHPIAVTSARPSRGEPEAARLGEIVRQPEARPAAPPAPSGATDVLAEADQALAAAKRTSAVATSQARSDERLALEDAEVATEEADTDLAGRGAGLASSDFAYRSLPPAVAPALVLRVPLPPAVRAQRRFEVRVISPEGDRELRQRFRGADVGDAIELSLPLAWDPSAAYRVEFFPARD